MRRKVLDAKTQSLFKFLKRATDAIIAEDWIGFRTAILNDPICMHCPTVESYIIEYETELGTELSVTDAAYRALVQLVDNVLKEDNHAYNRRLLMSRTVQATTSHHRKKET